MHLTTTSSPPSTAALVAVLCWAAALACLYLWYAFALSRLFPKLGSEGRKAWIPLVNDAEILALGGVPSWTVLLNFVPVVNLYAIALRIQATGRVNAGFGRGRGMTALAILLPPLWATILASSQPLSVASRMAPSVTRDRGFVADAEEPAIDAPAPGVPAMDAPAPEAPVIDVPAIDAPAPEQGSSARVSPYLDASSAVRAPSPRPVPSAHESPARPLTPPSPQPTPTPSTARIPLVAPVAPVAPPTPVTSVTPVAPVAPWSPTPADAAEVTGSSAHWTYADLINTSDGEFTDGETVLVDRSRKPAWRLAVEDHGDYGITGTHVLIGRRPSATKGTQALAVPDATRTLSKVHARLDRVDDEWVITDLSSTNGVVIVEADGTERLLEPDESATVYSATGTESTVSSSFILGSLTMSITFEDPST